LLLKYLLIKEGPAVFESFKRTGYTEFIGACGLVAAFLAIVLSAIATNGVYARRLRPLH
jgi:hypothetical protein